MKKLISIIVSIVLTVSVFTTAYATGTQNEIAPVTQAEPKQGGFAGVSQDESAIVQEVIRIIEEVFGLVQEEYGIAQEEFSTAQNETGEVTQEEGVITQTENNKAELRNMVVQYARELVNKYAPKFRGKTIIFPLDLVELYVDQSIAFLQARRGEYEAEIVKIKKEIDEVVRACRRPFPTPIMDMVMMIAIMILSIPLVCAQSASAQYRALIEAKQHYNYRLNGNEALSTVQEEHISK